MSDLDRILYLVVEVAAMKRMEKVLRSEVGKLECSTPTQDSWGVSQCCRTRAATSRYLGMEDVFDQCGTCDILDMMYSEKKRCAQVVFEDEDELEELGYKKIVEGGIKLMSNTHINPLGLDVNVTK